MNCTNEWDRGAVLGALTEASGVSLHVDDTLPDTLIARAQALGLTPLELKLWIYDRPADGWTAEGLEKWADRVRARSESEDQPQ